MKSKNICKFPAVPIAKELVTSCFVLEMNEETIGLPNTVRSNRVILVTQGEGKIFFDSLELPYSSGHLFFAFKGERIKAEARMQTSYMYIEFDGSRADELLRRFDIKHSNRCFEGFDGLIPLWSESLSRASEQTIDLASESILLYTFSRLSTGMSKDDGLVNRILEISEERFRDVDLSLSAVAEMLSYNPKYLSHVFKKKMGVGYSEYLRSLRIKYAISLFDHGLDSVKNVSILSGFSDPLYFSSVFKKDVGVSPSEYKKGERWDNGK
ncbi:MAG: helix-turn-helix transcriptional regulator [Ruminococcaceae bacterium]|nr:helix-turn-helix transcriptional regulator [Oscillospiraceae bacterium]